MVRQVLLNHSNKVIICFLIGLDIDRYNLESTGSKTDNRSQQLVVNDSVVFINRAILSLNMDIV